MDQQGLRQWENKCIQEELPECTAACPLHIDVRAFIGHIAEGNWAESLKILRTTMPLTNILGRICDAPCEERCKRREAGDAIRIGALERACLRRQVDRQRTPRLPAKGTRIAVIGSGLSSLTVAWDSIRKGYGVRILRAAKGPGGDSDRAISGRTVPGSPRRREGPVDGARRRDRTGSPCG